jgi:hypothetical protein
VRWSPGSAGLSTRCSERGECGALSPPPCCVSLLWDVTTMATSASWHGCISCKDQLWTGLSCMRVLCLPCVALHAVCVPAAFAILSLPPAGAASGSGSTSCC